jgi:hypothetical protein
MTAMRGLALYLLAGVLVVLAMDAVAPPVGLGLAFGAWHAETPAAQVVDRTGKSDRLPTLSNRQEPKEAAKPRPVMIGCDPVFSPLSASARANFAGRCMA